MSENDLILLICISLNPKDLVNLFTRDCNDPYFHEYPALISPDESNYLNLDNDEICQG